MIILNSKAFPFSFVRMHCLSYSLAEAAVFHPNRLISCGIKCTTSEPAIGQMPLLLKFSEDEGDDCDPCFTLLFHRSQDTN